MNYSISFSVQDNATATVRRLIETVQPKRIAVIIRSPLVQFWRRVIAGDIYQRPPSGAGSKRDAWARSVVGEATDEGVRLSVADNKASVGFRQRAFGGKIMAGDKKLSVPISDESYGKVPGDFPGLELAIRFVRGERRAYLVQRSYRTGPKGGKVVNSEKFLFRLMDEVTQGGNPQMIPIGAQFGAVANAAIKEALG